MKPLDPVTHGVIDYAAALSMIAAPRTLGFSRDRRARTSAVLSGVSILGLSLMTRYPLGALKVISFPTHSVIETLAALATVAAPWTLGFSHDRAAKMFHVMIGIGTLGVVAMTDYNQRRADMSLAEAVNELIGSGAQPQEAAETTRESATRGMAAGTR